jgi:hypothetical protein
MNSMPLPFNLLMVLLLSLAAWGILRTRSPEDSDGLMGTRDDVRWGILLLAGLATAVFIGFLFLSPRS